jgi:hypothetical protein
MPRNDIADDQPATPTPDRDVTSPPPEDTTPRTTHGDDDEHRGSNTTTIINHTGPISTGSEDQINVFHNGRLTSSQTVPAGTALPPEVAEKIRKAEAVAEQAMQAMRERFAGIPTPAPGTVHVAGTVGRRITGSTEPLHVGTGKQFVQGPDGQFHEVTRD